MQREYESPRSCCTRLGRSRPLPSAVALLCLFTSTPVAALGLGGAEVASNLNQPLDVRIPLHDVGPGDADAIEVGLASRARLRDAGLDGARYLDRLRFRVEPGAAGGHYVRVTSEEPIAEPFLRFLLRVDSGRGRVIRDYTLLLDPPAVATADAPPAAGSSAPASAAGAQRPQAEAAAPRPRTWGPVATGSSAWQVAAAVKPGDASIYQTMTALLRANPEAFRDGNLGGLKAGVRLTVPSPAAVRAIPQGQAVALYREHLGAAPEATEVADSADTAGAAGPVAARRLPDLSPIRSAGAAQDDGDAASSRAAAGDEAGPRLSVRLDDRLGDLAGAVDAVEARVVAEGDSITRALSSQSGQLDRVEGLLSGVREDVAALREAQPAAAPVARADAGGLSYRTGVLLALGGLLLGGVAGYAAGRGTRGLSRLGRRTPAEAPAAAGHATTGPEDGPVPTPAAQPRGDELPAERARPEAPVVTGGAHYGEAESLDISELEWDAAGSGGGPASSEDDHLFWADIYIAENLPREAEKIIRDAIALYGERPGYRVKLLEALYNAGAREQYLREATRYRAAAIDEGTWDAVVRMGRTLAPDHPPFSAAAEAVDAAVDEAGADPEVPPAPGADDELVAPDLSELDEAIGDDDGDVEAGVLLWDDGAPSDTGDDEAAATLDFDPLEVGPEGSSEQAGKDEARGGDDDAGEDDDYREVAGRR